MSLSVTNLIQQARAGDREALGRLLMLHDIRLRRRIGRRLGGSLGRILSVEDVLQETYAAAYRGIRKLECGGPEAFYKWLAVIADRKFLDGLKAHRSARRAVPFDGRRGLRDESTSFAGLLQVLDRGEKTPSGVIASREAEGALQAALASLPEALRKAVWMKHIEGKPASEIAVALGRSEPAVHQLCYRGLRRLREELGSRSKYLGESR